MPAATQIPDSLAQGDLAAKMFQKVMNAATDESPAKKFKDILTAAQKDNVNQILSTCSAYAYDEAQLAYVLSTAWGESNFKPIKEYRGKEGTPNYERQNKYWFTGFYGRGYVQLTWDYNYKAFGDLLGIDLVGNPDLALNPDTAAKIICYGMFHGKFTSKGKISAFISNSKKSQADFMEARRLINGQDKAEKFADRAIRILNA